MWCRRRMEKIILSEKVTNDEVLERTGEKRTLLHILCRKVNCIGHKLRRNCLLHGVIERQMTEVKGVGRRRTQLGHSMPSGLNLPTIMSPIFFKF